jgi:pimeloyl-ACP methyl ester carboxylesterase
MPQAPADYQTRYPIDFDSVDPASHQTPIQFYAADGGKSHGLLYQPAQRSSRTIIIMAHPRANFFQHYSIPYWLEAGFAVLAQNTRYLNNDWMMLHENLLLDLAAGIRFLREEQKFQHIVMLGNSGGGSLFAYYDAEARKSKGARVSAPPGGGPPDLNQYDLPTADGFILLAAHPGQGKVLMGSLDAAVVDEHDPFASDPALDMYDERNGFKTPPARSSYQAAWLERYREAQRARVSRIDAIARRHINEAQSARARTRATEFAAAAPEHRALIQRQMMAPQIMVVYRTQANPCYLDLSLDPSERDVGSIFSPRPDLFNYHAFGLAHVITPDAWLSTWSGLSSYANLARNLPQVKVPTLVVGAMADQDIFISDVRTEYELSSVSDKSIEFIAGADHFMRAGGTNTHLGEPRPRLMELLTRWTRERFAP